MVSNISETDLQYIMDSMSGSSSREKDVLIQDLRDCADSYQMLRMELRYVSINGDRIIINWNIKSNSYRFMSINGIKNHFVFAKYTKLFNEIITSENVFKYLKHLNDMSPEEYAWCTGADE
jgi:hypothetical protein